MNVRSAAAPPLSARGFLFEGATGTQSADVLASTISQHGIAPSALRAFRRLSGTATRVVEQEIASTLDGFLDIDLGHVLLSAWRTYEDLTDAAYRTLAAPEGEEVVDLLTHTVTSTYRPSVRVFLDEGLVHTFEFELSVRFDLVALAATVKSGDLVALHGGQCTITATLGLDGAPLAERRSLVDLNALVRLDPVVPLVEKPGPAPQIPAQATGRAVETSRRHGYGGDA